MKPRLLSSCFALQIILSAAPAVAAISTQDWLSEGDHLITHDSTTGLEWLNLTQTTGKSISNIEGMLSNPSLYPEYQGFRYATLAEWTQLIQNATGEAVPPSIDTITPISDTSAGQLVALLGATIPENLVSNPSLSGVLADTETFYYGNAGYIPGGLTLRLTSQVIHIAGSPAPDVSRVRVMDTVNPDLPLSDQVGHFLVRPSEIPIPTSSLLFFSSLIGLAVTGRRKNDEAIKSRPIPGAAFPRATPSA